MKTRKIFVMTVIFALLVTALSGATMVSAGTNLFPGGNFESGDFVADGWFTKQSTAGNVSLVHLQDTVGETTVQPFEGDYCARIYAASGASTSNDYVYIQRLSGAANNPFEAYSTYKLSFRYRCVEAANVPNFYLSVAGTALICNGQWYTIPASTQNVWNYYEIYFTTGADNVCEIRLRYPGVAYHVYYDDIRIEKEEGASISFYSAYSTSAFTNASFLSGNTPQSGYNIDGNATKIYPMALKGTEAATLGGTVKLVAQYIPTKIDETAILGAGIYELDEVTGSSRLVSVNTSPVSFAGTPDNPDTPTYYKMTSGIVSMDVNTASYTDPKYYIKGFLWSSLGDIRPLGAFKTLGNSAE